MLVYNHFMPIDNQLEIQHPRHQVKFVAPHITLGYLIIIVYITLGTAYTILSNNFSKFQADSEKIFDRHEFYRLLTSPFAVASFLDLFFMLLGFMWLLFTLTYYERKHSTIFVLYHFFKVNLGIIFGVTCIYLLLFSISRMKNFITNVGGIFPYCLHIYLKGCLAKPSEAVNHWFLPCPVNRWFMGLLVAVLLMFATPESQGCIVVLFYYLFCSVGVFLRYKTGFRCFYSEGPLCYKPIAIIQRILPKFITENEAFCSISQCDKISEQTAELEIQSQSHSQKQQLEEQN